MVFTKFVQVGRVVRVNYGQDTGKLATILDIVNDKRVLIEGPTTGVARQVIPIRRITLTKFHVKEVLRGQRSVLLKKKIEKFDLTKKWDATVAAKKEAAYKKRASLTDFERFKVLVLRKRRSNLLRHQIRVVAKASKAPQKGKAQEKTQQKGQEKGQKKQK